MKAWVNFTRLESQDSYNLQFVIQRSSSLSCIGDINSTKREEKIEERERERERERSGNVWEKSLYSESWWHSQGLLSQQLLGS